MIDKDWRNIANGLPLPSDSGYCDQPCIVTAADGSLVGVITTGSGDEGAFGEYVGIIRSEDRGRSWTQPLPLEDKDKESSYGVLISDSRGRLYCFYCYNLDGVRASDGISRRDMGGAFCFRFSDDCGRTWSERRVVPVREFALDREYPFYVRGKRYCFFWNVNAPFFDGDTLYIGLTKHHYGSFFGPEYPHRDVEKTESVLLRCKDFALTPDGKWETLPDGERGICPPGGGGEIAEEPCFVPLSDGSVFMIARSADGYPVCAYSRDGGKTFSDSFYPRHKNGEYLKNCRAVTVVWRLGKERYLLWFHNIFQPGYGHRNPVWCCPATETDGNGGRELEFGNPEILFYHPSEQISVNYPSHFVLGGRHYISETQKRIARIHGIPEDFLEKLFALSVFSALPDAFFTADQRVEIPAQTYAVLDSDSREDWKKQIVGGTTFLLKLREVKRGETLFNTIGPSGGFRAETDEEGFLRCTAAGKKSNFFLESSVKIADGAEHEIGWVTDGSARVSYLVIDGNFDNGGVRLDSGWKFVPAQMEGVCGGKGSLCKNAVYLAIYSRALMCAEVVGYFKNKGVFDYEKNLCDVSGGGVAVV